MTWLAWPAIAMLAVFIAVLVPPRRRLSHYVVALAFGSAAGLAAALLTALVRGIAQ